MKDYYFTFGQNHYTNTGVCMGNYWVRVRVKATDSDDILKSVARELFIQKFTEVNMPSKDRFAFQYTDEDFDPFYCPKGEHTVIIEDESLPKFKRKSLLKIEKNFYS